MVTIFAKENKLATIVGEKTAGRLFLRLRLKLGTAFGSRSRPELITHGVELHLKEVQSSLM